MKITVLFFGISKEITQKSTEILSINDNISVLDFKKKLLNLYPELKNIQSYAIAVNETYAEDSLSLKKNDVVAIIPPVSGG